MRDPFPIAPLPWLSEAVQPLADYLSFTTLPLHIHEILAAFLGYTVINFVVAPALSRRLLPVHYAKLSRSRQLNWDVHVVSFLQSVLITGLALWIIYVDEERSNMDWQGRVWGYTGATAMVQALATGYFLWDLMISIVHIKLFGVGMLAHAISALAVYSLGFRPYVNYYSCNFILYELSTPFLNIHWFFDKLDMTGSRPQLYNGIVLLGTFFGCRLVWGLYASVRVFGDMWNAIHHVPLAASIHLDALPAGNATAAREAALGKSALPLNEGIMRYAGEEYVPIWLVCAYLGSNLVLNGLNVYWFNQMIDAIRKRFQPPREKVVVDGGATREGKSVATVTSGANGSVKISAENVEVRKRMTVARNDSTLIAPGI